MCKDVAKVVSMPLMYLCSFLGGEIMLTHYQKSTVESVGTSINSSNLVVAASLAFAFLTLTTLITLKLLKRFHYLNNTLFLVFWGMAMGIVTVFLIGTSYSSPFFSLFYFLF